MHDLKKCIYLATDSICVDQGSKFDGPDFIKVDVCSKHNWDRVACRGVKCSCHYYDEIRDEDFNELNKLSISERIQIILSYYRDLDSDNQTYFTRIPSCIIDYLLDSLKDAIDNGCRPCKHCFKDYYAASKINLTANTYDCEDTFCHDH